MSTGNILLDHRMPNVPSNWNSLFIPMLPNDLIDECRLKYLIEFIYGFGKVKRIDFTKKENTNNKYMGFIHFEYWNQTDFTQSIRARLEHFNLVDLNYIGFLDNKTKFIRFMINKMPIKDTEMNAPQLANELELKINELNEKNKEIEELKNKILQLQDENINLHNKLYVSSGEEKVTEYKEDNTTDWLNVHIDPPTFTRVTNEPLDITHILYIIIDDIDSNNNKNTYYDQTYLIGCDKYVNQLNFMMFHILNIEGFKRAENVKNISICHYRENMFILKFDTSLSLYGANQLKLSLYSRVLNHLQNNLKIGENENMYSVNIIIFNSFHY